MIDLAGDLGRILEDAAGIAEDATYTPDGGYLTIALRAIEVEPDPVTPMGDPHVLSAVRAFLLRVADVASPAAGDALVVGGASYSVQGVPVAELRGAMWRVEVWPDPALALDRTVTLQRATTSASAFSTEAVVSGWDDLASVAVSRHVLSADEQWRAGLVEARRRARFTLRRTGAAAGLTSADRIVDGAETWSITGVVDRGGLWLEAMAEAVA